MNFVKTVYFVALWTLVQCQERCPDPENQHLCLVNGKQECIPRSFLCDGSRDCDDRSDETSNICLHRPCGFEEGREDGISLVNERGYRCNISGACISAEFVCDGFENCLDGDDETKEECGGKICKTTQFQCDYGACIPLIYVCNGLVNCHDGSDETPTLCKNFRACGTTQFTCDYGACIREGTVCNKKGNCRDNSDETEALCGAGHTFKSHPKAFGLTTEVPTTVTTPKPTTIETVNESGKGCSKQRSPGIFLEIICSEESCETSSLFPFGTEAAVECPTGFSLLVCAEDGLWHVIEGSGGPRTTFCEKSDLGTTETVGPQKCSYLDLQNIPHEILKCPDEPSIADCSRKIEMSPGTLVSTSCGGMETQVLMCSSEGHWHVLADTGLYVPELCMDFPRAGRPTSCGNAIPLTGQAAGFQWSFLVGLFLDGNYICTGVFISSELILTASHCIVKNQGGTSETISPQQLKVQHSQNGIIVTSVVSSIHTHPNFLGGSQPIYDAAILKLARPSIVNGELEPICIDTEGALLGVRALTFNRTLGVHDYQWEIFPETMDTRCFNKVDPCSRALSISSDQFCGVNKDSPRFLHQGSSGGPYIIEKEGLWYVAGIVSRFTKTSDEKIKCNPPHTVFTSVSHINQWINSCMEGSC